MRRRVKSREFGFRRSLGRLLRERRLAQFLSQQDLATMLATTQSSISNYENGRSEVPLSLLVHLCRVLEISMSDLVFQVEAEAGGPRVTSHLAEVVR
jgi:transcriptional regulator with XRE-family HTH domain